LVPLIHESDGYQIDLANNHGWYELPAGRGLAGYGLARALRLLLDVLSGLSALHDTQNDNGQPFTHGELVPALVRVDRSGAARLIPLAPWHRTTLGKQPSPERIGHLAPERLLGDVIDQRADVFSAGVLLWEALAGRRLFEADSVDEIITRLMGGRITLPALPPELAWAVPLKDVAVCALSVDPERRFANAADFAEAIEAVAAQHVASHAEVAAFFGARDPHARPSLIERPNEVPTHNSSLSALVSPVAHAEAAQAASSAAREAIAPSSRGRGRLWAGAAGLSLLVGVGVGVGLASRSAGRAPEPRAPSAAVGARAVNEPLAPLPSALPASRPAPSASSSVPPAPVDVGPPASAAPAVTTPSGKTKAPKSVKGLKTSPPKLKAPSKPAAGRGKEAELYGI
jgi:eukaryotic-like serine/threonine-protein kinase